MSLVLIETALDRGREADVDRYLSGLDAATDGRLVESRVSTASSRLFAVVEHDDPNALAGTLDDAGVNYEDIAPVRLVGADLDEVKAAASDAPRYLVEWDLPEELDMETYLANKKAKSPRYDTVPEVTFRRTYVREDLDKCLCFYDAGCEDDVRRARKVVEAPVDRFHELSR